MAKKRHHHTPKAYLKSFCDEKGTIRVYRKNDPCKVLQLSPDNVGFHKYYYSQPRPEGGQDHDSLENFFATIETKWPKIVDRLHSRLNVNASLEDLFVFMALQRARVPASRDATERIYAERVKMAARELNKAGKLPEKPDAFKDILDQVEVSINPHQSIHAMVDVMRGFSWVFGRIGFCAMHNRTDVPFLTSDNPVIWFDPSVKDAELRPYVLHPDGPVALLFPVSPSLTIYGHSSLRQRFSVEGLGMEDVSDTRVIEMINQMVCRFAYHAVFAQKPGQERLVEENAALSPTIRFDRIATNKGESVIFQMVFGKREQKPKWINRRS